MFVGVILLRKTDEVGSAYMDAAELRFENGEDALEQGLINFIGPGVPLSGPPPGCMPWQQVARCSRLWASAGTPTLSLLNGQSDFKEAFGN
jgi:hypothetical protein